MLEHWDKVTPIALLDYNNERDKIYFTMLMKHITKVGRIEWVANVLANFIGDSPIRLGVFLKAFHIA